MTVEIVIAINKINLHTRGKQGGHFDYEGMIGIVDFDIEAGETNYFVELIATLVNDAVAGHESAHLGLGTVDSLRELAGKFAKLTGGYIRSHFLRHKENFIEVHGLTI